MPERRALLTPPLARQNDGDALAVGLGGLQSATTVLAGFAPDTSAVPAGGNDDAVARPAQDVRNAAAMVPSPPGEVWPGAAAMLGASASILDTGTRGIGIVLSTSNDVGAPTAGTPVASFQFLAVGDAASSLAPIPPDLVGIADGPAWLDVRPVGDGERGGPVDVTSASKGTHPSPTQLVDFKLKQAIALTSLGSLSYSLPGAFYQSFSKSLSYGADGFGAFANIALAGGIKGSFNLSFGTILPDYPLLLNAETVGSVADGKVFTVSPTLIATDDAFFKLGLPTADATAAFGIKLKGGVGLSFPTVTIGVGPFSTSFGPPSIYASIADVNDIQKLATGKTENFNGGYATISELTGGTYKSTATYSKYGLPTITRTAYTQPFLQAQFDPLAALGAYIPELKALDGSENFGVGHASWSLLSLPIDASLEIANSVTLTQTGFNVSLTEHVGGAKTNLGTHAVTIGTSQGQQWQLTAPASGGGVIDLTLDYTLTLSVQSAISLFGSFGLTLDGPQASVDILGHSFNPSPLFSFSLVNERGNLFTYDLPSTVVTLSALQHDQVFYGPIAAEQTLAMNLDMHYELKAGGERFEFASGFVIAPDSNTVGATIGIEGTLGAAAVYNYGSIYPYAANPSLEGDKSIGINLPGGGQVVNAGNIDYVVSVSGKYFSNGDRYGIDIGGYNSTVVNSGKIFNGIVAGIELTGTAGDNAYVLNSQTGTLLGTGYYGIAARDGVELDVNNEGLIQLGGGRFGVYAQTGLFLINSGVITAGADTNTDLLVGSADIYSGGIASSYVDNEGTIGIYTGPSAGKAADASVGVALGYGIVANSGTIAGARYGVYFGRNSASAFVENAGLIEATGTAGTLEAVRLLAGSNVLQIDPGARFIGGAFANSKLGAGHDTIVLNTGSVTGTLNMTGGAMYTGFGQIDVFPAASWELVTTQPINFYGATINGLTGRDLIDIKGLAYSTGESILLNTSTDMLTLYGNNHSILDQIQLGGSLSAAEFHVRGGNGNTYIRQFSGNFTDVITGTIGAQTVNANSYYGGKLTVASGASVSYSAQGGGSAFGIDLQAVTSAATSTIGGVTTVSTSVSPAALTNFGVITGQAQGVYLQSPGAIYNKVGARISGHTYGIEEKAAYSGVFIGNSGSISGGQAGIYLAGGGTIVNLGNVYGSGLGLQLKSNAFIYNAGTIRGAQSEGISMVSGAVVNAAGGTITGGKYGIEATGSQINVTNSGSIGGNVGILLTAGGGVTNSYATSGGGPLAGTISGARYAVEIIGGAGTILNEANGLARQGDQGLIQGVFLGFGGEVLNGADGDITNAHGYAINLAGDAAAIVSNQGMIGSIYAGGSDRIVNGLGGQIGSVAGGTGAPTTIQNHGTIGNAAVAVGIYESGPASIYNVGGAGSLAVIEGRTGIILSNGGLIDNSANGLIEGLGGSGIQLLAGGTIENAGQITGSGSGFAAIYMNGGTLTDLGLISGTNGAAAMAFGATAATVILDPGAAFVGSVTGNGKNDTLNLGGSGPGTLGGIGSEITGFKTNAVLAGSDWFLTGTNTLAGNWNIAGTLVSGQPSSGVYDGLIVTGSVTVSGHVGGQNAYRGTTGGGATGIDLQSGKITNSGTITGGYGALGGYSADGVDISGGTLTNSGMVKGGSYSFAAGSGNGGNGVDLFGGVLTNAGHILGGATGGFYGSYSPGGTGLLLGGPGLATNNGTITGGAGSYTGGKGASVGDGSLTNNRRITGGYGKFYGGDGAVVAGGTLLNAGTLTGGGGSVGVGDGALVQSGTLTNDGLIIAGAASGLTGIGVELTGGTLVNAGTISGSGGGAAVQFGGAASLVLDPGAIFIGTVIADVSAADTLVLAGTLPGTLSGLGSQFSGFTTLAEESGANWSIAGTGSFAGGASVDGQLTLGGTLTETGDWTVYGTVDVTGSLNAAGVITGGYGITALGLQSGVLMNSGTLAGGGGNYSYPANTGVNGGTGMAQSGGYALNTGLVTGGSGVASREGLPGYAGGAGVVLTGGTLANAGRIQGGAGAYCELGGGTGGTGVSLLGGTLINAGTIQGGNGGYGVYGYTTAGNGGAGVYLDGGTLTTSGAIGGGGGGADLGGSQNGAAGDAVLFGAQAATLVIDPGATFGGAVVANSAVNDVLELAGTTTATLSGLGTAFAGFSTLVEASGAHWTLAGPSSFAGAIAVAGTLTETGSLALGGMVSGAGKITVGAKGTISGTGTIAVVLSDMGLVEAQGGTLLLNHALSGSGTLAAASGATLKITKTSALHETLTGAGTIAVTSAATLASGARLNAGTFLQEASLKLATGENLTPGGQDYILQTSSATNTIALSGAAANVFTNNAVLEAEGAGTSQILVSLSNAGTVDSSKGTFSLLGSVTNTGTLSAQGGILLVAQSVGGTGMLDIGSASRLWLQDGAASGQTASFTASSGTLELSTPTMFMGHIAEFGGTDVIELAATAATTLSFQSGVLSVDNGSSVVASLRFNGNYTTTSFSLTADGHGNSLITFV